MLDKFQTNVACVNRHDSGHLIPHSEPAHAGLNVQYRDFHQRTKIAYVDRAR